MAAAADDAKPPAAVSESSAQGGDGTPAVDPDVLERWNADVAVIREALKLILSNRLVEADTLLEGASQEVAGRSIDFSRGDHDLRGAFAFVGAMSGLLNGLAFLESNQLDRVLTRVWAADELLALDREWAGRTVLRGLCIFVAGLCEMFKGSYTQGVWHVLRSWLFLRILESEGLNVEGHEREVVRSTSLLALGVFNLLVSMLPPGMMRTATWLTGFTGGRQVALDQLRTAYHEQGLQAPIAGLTLVGFSVDASTFLGELRAEREQRYSLAKEVLDWAAVHYPDAFFFQGLESVYSAVTGNLEAAVEKLDQVAEAVSSLPAFLFLVRLRQGAFLAASLRWQEAAEAFIAAAAVHRKVKRRAFCPTLFMTAHICYTAASQDEKAAEMLQEARSYRNEKKKWHFPDALSLRQAELAHAVTASAADALLPNLPPSPVLPPPPPPAPEPPADDDDEAFHDAADGTGEGSDSEAEEAPVPPPQDETWRPLLVLYHKLCIVWRSVTHMRPEQVDRFTSLVQEEIDACGDDYDSKTKGLYVLAEAMRQSERWDEALDAAKKGLELAPKLSKEAQQNSPCLPFLQLVLAYALYGKGNPSAARDALVKLDLQTHDYKYKKSVDFKATHLKHLVGLEFRDNYQDLSVPARSRRVIRVNLEGPELPSLLEWDWVLADFTVNFTATFHPAGGADPVELQNLDQYSSSDGPVVGSLEVKGPGEMELVFDNSFSWARGKTVQLRVQPSTLTLSIS